MRTFVAEKGSGKTPLLISRALTTAHENPTSKIYIVTVNAKKAGLLKKKASDSNDIPNNVEFIGADVLFAKGPGRRKTSTPARFFFDDLDDILTDLCKGAMNSPVFVDFATATEEVEKK